MEHKQNGRSFPPWLKSWFPLFLWRSSWTLSLCSIGWFKDANKLNLILCLISSGVLWSEIWGTRTMQGHVTLWLSRASFSHRFWRGRIFYFFAFTFFYFFLFFGFFTTLQVFLCTELNINAWSFCNTFLSQPLYWTGVTRNYKEYSLSVLSLWIVPRNIIRATFISESRDCNNKTPVPSSQRKTSGTQGSSLAFSSLRQSCFCRAELFKIQELS